MRIYIGRKEEEQTSTLVEESDPFSGGMSEVWRIYDGVVVVNQKLQLTYSRPGDDAACGVITTPPLPLDLL